MDPNILKKYHVAHSTFRPEKIKKYDKSALSNAGFSGISNFRKKERFGYKAYSVDLNLILVKAYPFLYICKLSLFFNKCYIILLAFLVSL
jgi:hypothetical protein